MRKRTSSTRASGLPSVRSARVWLTCSAGATPAISAISAPTSASGRPSTRSCVRPGSPTNDRRVSSWAARLLARRQEQRDRLGPDPAPEEEDRVEGRGVGPLHVVEDEEHRALLSGLADQGQEAQRDQEPVGRASAGHSQGDSHRVRLGFWQLVEQGEQRVQELVGGRVGEIGLGFHAGGAQDAEAGFGRGLVEQRGLADAGYAAQEEHAAPRLARGLEQPLDARPLGGAADQHDVHSSAA